MALQLKNAPGQAGHVLLVFDRTLDVDPLRIAIYNCMSRAYLGRSTGRALWSPVRSQFFEARLVAHNDGQSTFKIGPEVTTFIPDETTIELTSEDGALRETVVWHSIMLDYHWAADADENDRHRRGEVVRRQQAGETEQQSRLLFEEDGRRQTIEKNEAGNVEAGLRAKTENTLEVGAARQPIGEDQREKAEADQAELPSEADLKQKTASQMHGKGREADPERRHSEQTTAPAVEDAPDPKNVASLSDQTSIPKVGLDNSIAPSSTFAIFGLLAVVWVAYSGFLSAVNITPFYFYLTSAVLDLLVIPFTFLTLYRSGTAKRHLLAAIAIAAATCGVIAIATARVTSENIDPLNPYAHYRDLYERDFAENLLIIGVLAFLPGFVFGAIAAKVFRRRY
jgi:hypothetical protein